MPLTDKGKKIKKSMIKQYGKKEGEAVFYATKNKGKIKGVVKKAAMGRAMFAQSTSKAPGDAQLKKEPYNGSYIKSEIDGTKLSNKSYEKYYGSMLKGFKI